MMTTVMQPEDSSRLDKSSKIIQDGSISFSCSSDKNIWSIRITPVSVMKFWRSKSTKPRQTSYNPNRFESLLWSFHRWLFEPGSLCTTSRILLLHAILDNCIIKNYMKLIEASHSSFFLDMHFINGMVSKKHGEPVNNKIQKQQRNIHWATCRLWLRLGIQCTGRFIQEQHLAVWGK